MMLGDFLTYTSEFYIKKKELISADSSLIWSSVYGGSSATMIIFAIDSSADDFLASAINHKQLENYDKCMLAPWNV